MLVLKRRMRLPQIQFVASYHFSVAVLDPEYPRRGRDAYLQGGGANLIFGLIFPECCMKMKEIGPEIRHCVESKDVLGTGYHLSPFVKPFRKCLIVHKKSFKKPISKITIITQLTFYKTLGSQSIRKCWTYLHGHLEVTDSKIVFVKFLPSQVILLKIDIA